MYYPFFRGKQFELLAIKEFAGLFSKNDFTPVIEPVKNSLNGLRRSIEALINASANAILIVNPIHGYYATDSHDICEYVSELSETTNVRAGILLTEDMELRDIASLVGERKDRLFSFIHAGYTDGRELAEYTCDLETDHEHIFLDAYCGKLYQRHFHNHKRILIKDGFQQRRNSDHPVEEYFSDLHVTYAEEGMDGFGDFLIVGDNYSDVGGPAYAVAIHITYVDRNADGEMKIFHFLSDRRDTPTDPAGKFLESLEKLVSAAESPDTKLFHGKAIREFLDLYKKKHYPGLGVIRKLSMQHHIEVMADFLN